MNIELTPIRITKWFKNLEVIYTAWKLFEFRDFSSVHFFIWTKYGDSQSKSMYSFRMQKNKGQKKFQF